MQIIIIYNFFDVDQNRFGVKPEVAAIIEAYIKSLWRGDFAICG